PPKLPVWPVRRTNSGNRLREVGFVSGSCCCVKTELTNPNRKTAKLHNTARCLLSNRMSFRRGDEFMDTLRLNFMMRMEVKNLQRAFHYGSLEGVTLEQPLLISSIVM